MCSTCMTGVCLNIGGCLSKKGDLKKDLPQEYVDDSLAMANLWLARNLSFFVELPGPSALRGAYSQGRLQKGQTHLMITSQRRNSLKEAPQ